MNNSSASAVIAVHLGNLYALGTHGALTDDQLLERFVTRTDLEASEAAFAALVDRHGAMVRGVCQRFVHDPHDADDAFQATFVVLARRAKSIRGRGSIAGWLFGIARRVALRARAESAKRRRHLEKFQAELMARSRQVGTSEPTRPEPDYSPLIVAIARLPERLRSPVVLHYFEGLDTATIAQRLGCPRGTVLSRLARARERLRHRLEHREFALESLLPVTPAASRVFAGATVPSRLLQCTVKAATSISLGGHCAEGVVPATVLKLSSGVVRGILRIHFQVIFGLAAVAALGVMLGRAAIHSQAGNSEKDTHRTEEPPVRGIARFDSATKQGSESLLVRGQVLDPHGRPVNNAQIITGVGMLDELGWQNYLGFPPEHLATTKLDGSFQTLWNLGAFDPEDLEPGQPSPHWLIAALSPGFGPGLCRVVARGGPGNHIVRLRRDDVPIEGRVVNKMGRPISGASVHILAIADLPDGLVANLRDNRRAIKSFLADTLNEGLILGEKGPIPAVQTGRDGRFRLMGIGRDRAAALLVDGETIDRTFAMVLTSNAPNLAHLRVPPEMRGDLGLFGPQLEIEAAPGRPIYGSAHDADTGRPFAGAHIHSWAVGMGTTSDELGRFRVNGSPASRNTLIVKVDGQPYIEVVKPVGSATEISPIRAANTEPIHTEISLKRGTWVEGRVIDRATGRPIKASVEYRPLRDNPHLKECPDAWFFFSPYLAPQYRTDADGRFRAVALPGDGMIAVRAEPGYRSALPLASAVSGKVVHSGKSPLDLSYCNALVPIRCDNTVSILLPTISLAPAQPQRIQIDGPDGRPVAGVRWYCSQQRSPRGEPVTGSAFTFKHESPGHLVPVVIMQDEHDLAGVVVITGNEPDPIRVALHRTGTLTGRVVDNNGRPRPFFRIVLNREVRRPEGNFFVPRVSHLPKTDADGRFRLTGLVVGLWHVISSPSMIEAGQPGWIVKPAEELEVGDVRVMSDHRE
jgi:RNA polymerase sigma factor (sigma-70 family)